jgi:hypothetical protein
MAADLLQGSRIEASCHRAVASASEQYRSAPFSQEFPHFERLFSGSIGGLAGIL